jgi:integral membrane protein
MLVQVLGPIHGLLFVWLCIEIAQAVFGKDWPLRRGALVLGAALFPLGPFLIDGWLKAQQATFDASSRS